MIGTVFGRLTVVSLGRANGRKTALCRCTCGNEKSVQPSDLRRGFVQSCGCLSREITIARNKRSATHGMSRTSEHKIWAGMLARCLTPSDKYYPRYGGRGITVCPEWREFLNFYHDMGPRPSKGHSIDRIDNNGPYEPGNCRWATWTEQERNRRNNRLLTINGETLPVSAWAEKTGVPAGKIYLRLRYGIPPEKAIQAQSLRTPARSTNRLLTINGETHPVSEWAKLVGIPAPTIYTRLYHGRTPSEAIQTAHFRRSDAASRT